MNAPKRDTLAGKLRASIIVLTGSLLGVAAIVYALYAAFDTYSAGQRYAESLAQIVANNATAALSFFDERGGEEVLSGLRSEPDVVGAVLSDSDGRVFAGHGDTKRLQVAVGDDLFLRSTPALDFGHVVIRRPVTEGGTVIGSVTLLYRLTIVYSTLRRHLLVSFTVLLMLLITAVPIAKRLGSSLLRPVESLRETMGRVSERGDFSLRAQKFDDDEIGYLVERFNIMLGQLADRDDRLGEQREELERRVEALKIAEEAALAAAHSKSQFLANMSHEIRTPMNGVLGMLNLVRDTPLTAEQSEQIETAFSSAEGLLTIINDILDLSKIEAGKMELAQAELIPAEIIEDVGFILAPQARSKGIDLDLILAPACFDGYRGDPTRLRQILLNLAGNAVKFTQEGQVTLRASVSRTNGGAALSVAVQDTGIGIEATKLDSLFEAFGQADVSNTRKYGGTGLGLTISRQLAELMGGTIEVTSTLGQGSRFAVAVPLLDEPASSLAAVADPSTGADAARVALRLASTPLAEAASLLLQRLGIRAPSFAEDETFDAVITDDPAWTAPRGTTVQVLRQWDGKPPPNGVRVLTRPLRLSQLQQALSSAASEPKGEKPGTPAPAQYAEARVLLAEDNAVNQLVAKRMLGRFGIECAVVGNGSEAVSAVADRPFDLVFMDCQMPEMDGLEATRRIRDREAEARTRPMAIVALTANAMEGDRERCLSAGMDDYLPKPIHMEALGRLLAKWLGASAQATGQARRTAT